MITLHATIYYLCVLLAVSFLAYILIKKYSIWFTIATVFVSLVTNPNESKHEQLFKESLYDKMETDNISTRALAMSLSDDLSQSMVRVDNFLVFSVSYIQTPDEQTPFAIGLFGQLFIQKSGGR